MVNEPIRHKFYLNESTTLEDIRAAHRQITRQGEPIKYVLVQLHKMFESPESRLCLAEAMQCMKHWEPHHVCIFYNLQNRGNADVSSTDIEQRQALSRLAACATKVFCLHGSSLDLEMSIHDVLLAFEASPCRKQVCLCLDYKGHVDNDANVVDPNVDPAALAIFVKRISESNIEILSWKMNPSPRMWQTAIDIIMCTKSIRLLILRLYGRDGDDEVERMEEDFGFDYAVGQQLQAAISANTSLHEIWLCDTLLKRVPRVKEFVFDAILHREGGMETLRLDLRSDDALLSLADYQPLVHALPNLPVRNLYVDWPAPSLGMDRSLIQAIRQNPYLVAWFRGEHGCYPVPDAIHPLLERNRVLRDVTRIFPRHAVDPNNTSQHDVNNEASSGNEPLALLPELLGRLQSYSTEVRRTSVFYLLRKTFMPIPLVQDCNSTASKIANNC